MGEQGGFRSETVRGINGKEKACLRRSSLGWTGFSDSKMPRCKRSPRMAFEIFLKDHSLLARAKCDRRFNFPGTMFGCVGNFSRIVGIRTTPQVVGQPGIVAGRLCIAREDINIVKALHVCLFSGLPRRSSQRPCLCARAS